MFRLFDRTWKDDKGAAGVEQTLVLGMVILAALSAVPKLGPKIRAHWILLESNGPRTATVDTELPAGNP